MWDCRAQIREFEKLYMREAGFNTKLCESWEGPYRIERKNSPLSYKLNTGDVHIQLFKKFVPRKSKPRINRITSVFDPDTPEDNLENRYSEAKVEVIDSTGAVPSDIAEREEEFRDTLTNEPGLMNLADFSIDTYTYPPIFQRAYSTPKSLIESVDRE